MKELHLSCDMMHTSLDDFEHLLLRDPLDSTYRYSKPRAILISLLRVQL